MSSGSTWFIELMPESFEDPIRTNTAVQIVREICFTPSPTPAPTSMPGGQTPTNITIGGDIHFTTLDNVIFTFNGAGDYIYSSTPNIFDLHIRAAMIGRASVYHSVPLHLGSFKASCEHKMRILFRDSGS